jgi:hypothetical protein
MAIRMEQKVFENIVKMCYELALIDEVNNVIAEAKKDHVRWLAELRASGRKYPKYRGNSDIPVFPRLGHGVYLIKRPVKMGKGRNKVILCIENAKKKNIPYELAVLESCGIEDIEFDEEDTKYALDWLLDLRKDYFIMQPKK